MNIPPPVSIVGNQFVLGNLICKGGFGLVYECENIKTHQKSVCKLESSANRPQFLEYEATLYKVFAGGVGIPAIRLFSKEDYYLSLCIEKLGDSIDALHEKSQRKFSLKTVYMIAIQILERIEFIHSKNFIHRDIKPNNFLIGIGRQSNQIYIIDFGLSKKFCNPRTLEHIKFKTGKSITGTSRFMSINANKGFEQSRRDDLESVAYVLIYLLTGTLPWVKDEDRANDPQYVQVLRKKEAISTEELCDGLPRPFYVFLSEVKHLKFEERPNYSHFRSLFSDAMIKEGFSYDYAFDWVVPRAEKPAFSPIDCSIRPVKRIAAPKWLM